MPNPGRAAGTPVARRGAVSTRPGRSTRHGSDGMRRKRYRAVPDPGKAAGSGRRGLAVGMLPSRWTAKRSDGVRPETRRAVPGRGKAAGSGCQVRAVSMPPGARPTEAEWHVGGSIPVRPRPQVEHDRGRLNHNLSCRNEGSRACRTARGF